MTEENILLAARAMSARQLEDLISKLMDVRYHKAPPVSEKPPGADGTCEQQVTIEDDPSIAMRRLRDGRVRMWIRSSGIGWFAFNFSTDRSITIRDWLNANTDQKAIPPLLGQGDGNTNAH